MKKGADLQLQNGYFPILLPRLTLPLGGAR